MVTAAPIPYTAGDDVLKGGLGEDVLMGEAGNDVLTGGSGTDHIHGGVGNDILDGQGARDIVNGDEGNDVLTGGLGNDDLFGGLGDDQLDGQGDTDLCDGGTDGETTGDTASATCEFLAGIEGAVNTVEPVSFSLDHGFFTSPQTVVLTSATPSATISYTTDGNTPSNATGTLVESGSTITVDETTVLRATAFRSGWTASASETRSYLFTSDIVQQPETPPTGWPEDRAVNNMRAFYGFDADLSAASRDDAEAALLAIPSISISADLEDLFDPTIGIWSNPRERGAAWERPAAIELLDPTGAESGFEINGGIRIKGNSSRSPQNFKHSMRLVFDNDYGDGELNYPVHGAARVEVFESLDLKTAQSWSWNGVSAPNEGRGTEATWLRDIWNRDSQGASTPVERKATST